MLQLRKFCKSYPTMETRVLNDINFTLNQEDFCVLIGSNGSGKSTLFKAITGEIRPCIGTISLNGKNITPLTKAKRSQLISHVSQDITLGTTQQMTLLENLSLSYMRGKNATFSFFKQNRSLLKEQISAQGLGLEKYFDKKMSALSGGQRQMAATVMATLSKPEILLLDEHCSALDPKTQIKVMEYTDKVIATHRISALMITHSLSDAITYGNRLVMLHQGKIVLDLNETQKRKLQIADLLAMFQQVEKETSDDHIND